MSCVRMRFGAALVCLALLGGCGLPAFKHSTARFLASYESALRAYKSGDIMAAREMVLRMDPSRPDYADARKLLKQKIEPARLRLLRHYAAAAKRAEQAGLWYRAKALYERAAGFSTKPQSLQDEARRMDLRMRQIRLDRLTAIRRQDDAHLLAMLDRFDAPKGLSPEDAPFRRAREDAEDRVLARARAAWLAAKRELREGYPEVAWVEIESFRRLRPDAERGRRLMQEVRKALPKGLRIPSVREAERPVHRVKPPKTVTAAAIRALIRKGQLVAVDRLGDAGHVFQVLDESGALVPGAHIEIDGQVYAPQDGKILVPFTEEERKRSLIVVDGSFAASQQFTHRTESYALEAALALDEQALVSGRRARMIVRPRLTCNGRPVSLQLLEDVSLNIRTQDADGIESTLVTGAITASDADALVHDFLVPSRVREVTVELKGRIYNRSQDQYQDLEAVQSMPCSTMEDSVAIADLYLQRMPDGARVFVLGRNGEPVSGMVLRVSIKPKGFAQEHAFQLATDQRGAITLRGVASADRVQVSGRDLAPLAFQTEVVERAWPERIQVPQGRSIELPLGAEAAHADEFVLREVRGGEIYRRPSDALRVAQGMLVVENLAAGEYQLVDYRNHRVAQLYVVQGKSSSDYVFGHRHIVEPTGLPAAAIGAVQIEDGRIAIRLSRWDTATRVHVVGTVFEPTLSRGSLDVSQPDYARSMRGYPRNLWVDSLTLDEEYRYILERQTAQKYPGNLLPQPSLLVHPWEITTADNVAREARAGDAIPKVAQPERGMAQRGSRMRRERGADAQSRKGYTFLNRNAVVQANLIPDKDGWVRLDAGAVEGCSTIVCLAVHPLGSDSRRLVLKVDRIPVRDLRLAKAFDLDQPVHRVRRIDVIHKDQPLRLENPEARRIQLYTTVADVFDLYATLVESPHWEEFRFLRQWDRLDEARKRQKYDAHGCHELDLFLYFKDREFFDAVVAPVLRNKLEKRFLDDWLLGDEVDSYAELWRLRRLNAAERVLMGRRFESLQAGTRRFLSDWIEAHPIAPERLMQLFEFALLRSQLASPTSDMGGEGFGLGGMGGGVVEKSESRDLKKRKVADDAPMAPGSSGRLLEERLQEPGQAATAEAADALFFGTDRRSLGRETSPPLFRSLDQTREWAESNYYRLRLEQQTSDLVLPNPFWLEVFDNGGKPLLSQNIHLPVNNFHEALMALAFIDLPFSADAPQIEMQAEAATIRCGSDAIMLSESFEPAETSDDDHQAPPIMVGHEIYLANEDPMTGHPVTDRPLVRAVAYRSRVVVSNPSATPVTAEILLQIPQGALPLEGSKAVRSVPIRLAPYETQQVDGAFYFPEAGEFSMYGAQVSVEGRHAKGAPGRILRVLDEPDDDDRDSWEYVADWGTADRVLEFLRDSNLQEIDLSRIAFRMADREFYDYVLDILEPTGVFDVALWAYAVRHDDPPRIEQLLQHHDAFLQRLGSRLECPILHVIPEQRGWYEFLEYRPLVVARAHQLGADREILNRRLREQYLRLMQVLTHQSAISQSQRLQLAYYMLLQNRIEESLQHFAQVDRQAVEPVASYDYMDAYLAMYRGDYQRARRLAEDYAAYPSPRLQAVFSLIRAQLDEREAMLAGREPMASLPSETDSAAPVETTQREVQQSEMARRNPALELESSKGQLIAHLRNIDAVQINYYEMDVELLFSRRPFATTQDAAAPIVKPNHTKLVDVQGRESLVVEIPEELQHKNLIVEVQAAGISRRQFVTAGELRVVLVEPYGRLQVAHARGGMPVVGAYVKVYARHPDGSIRFFKDGYTDLRGQFDYATISTGGLDGVKEFAILVLDDALGPSIHQARPPAR